MAGLVGPVRPARAEDPGGIYDAIRDDYLKLKEDEAARRFRHNYLRIIDRFEAFAGDHPDDERAPRACYNAGQLAWDLYLVSRVRGDLERSMTLFRRLADTWPDDRHADDAVFLIGRIRLEHGGDPSDAWRAFAEVVDRFPDGDMRPKAKEMLGRLAAHRPQTPEPTPKAETRKTLARATSWTGAAQSESARVTGVKTWSNDGFTRVAVYLDGSVSWREGEVPPDQTRGLPRRYYIDLKKAVLTDEAAAPVAVGDGLLTQVRTGQFSPDTVRVVLDVETLRHARVFPMENPHRLLIDITGEDGVLPNDESPAVASATEPTEAPEPKAKPGKETVAKMKAEVETASVASLSLQAGLKIRRVVVDAGHGGHDRGAHGPTGASEKDVALSIAKKLGKKLETLGLEVIYTRTDDTFIPLEERTAIANTRRADLFISIHCNGHPRKDRYGTSTYYLDISHDRYAIRLAARENATTERSVGDLQLILADLATRSNTDDSKRLANSIQTHTVKHLKGKYSRVRDLGVKYALFYVLLGAKMPSVLVETSFITNPTEEKRLKTGAYQERVADGVYQGVKQFIEDRRAVLLGKK